ncbi:MAG: ATP-binding protein [Bacteroides sp.]|jgi:hypothetical protein|nr:ATP-binding protein [Bacteroides sp.]MCI1681028.1 ATP-binding protein [Bacteroides sp.]
MEYEVKESFDLLLAISSDETTPLVAAYRQLRDLLERLCRKEMSEGNLQITDLSARISFVASKLSLSFSEQNRLHTFRLTSNAILNGDTTHSREHLLRDIKTLTFFVKRITGANIPDELYDLLPRADAAYLVAPFAKERRKRIRVCFQYADDTYLYVNPIDEIVGELLRVRYNIPEINEEFAETCKLLWCHARLNLLDVAVDEEGILTPSFIILEPDYLIDISSLAECFNAYGHHPANYLLNRLRLSENTRPLLLGNIANLFLDEWIHAEGEPDYLTCMKKAFRTYSIELATCPELFDREKERDFFVDCKRHFMHIKQTVQNVFPTPGYELDKTDAVLEPSYICEALGLQGRLDYMQRDMSSFIEMKSGKADEYAIRGKVEPKENNRVQMLLYQAVLEYSMGMSHRRVKAYLLYTRYPLLYPARSSWAMVRRVMDVRNRIVANEYSIQLHNNIAYTSEKLEEINPETLNERHLNNTLWKRYLYPVIDDIHQHIKTLSSVEKCYFYSLYNFITKELYTSKTGDVDYEGHCGAASLWLSSLAEKKESGEILYDLKIKESHAADPHKAYIVLSQAGKNDDRSEAGSSLNGALVESLPNFRNGDAIVFYERNEETDNVTNKMIFKGNIEDISDAEIRIRLRASQQNTSVLPPDSSYAIEHDYMDTTFRSMYAGLSAFLSANQERRDLLLGCRNPRFDTSLDARVASAQDDFSRVVLKAQAAEDYFLLVGPPGTGKTSRALRGMVEAFHREGKQILLLSYTNRAVDEICKALSSITSEIDFIRIGSELSCDTVYRSRLIENVLEACSTRKDVQERITGCSVFVGTVATLSSKTDIFRLKTFDVAIIDEASQILEPQLLGLLCARGMDGGDAIRKFVLIGDYKQLPAVVLQDTAQSSVHSECLNAIELHDLRDSLFERLYRYESKRNKAVETAYIVDKGVENRSFDTLCRQGRMHPEIAWFPNHAFYGGCLKSLGLLHQQGDLVLVPELQANEFASALIHRMVFIPSNAELPIHSIKINHSEAVIAARLAAAVYKQYQSSFEPSHTLGIITPYRSQIALIKSEILSLGISALNNIVVDTVERFQGSERDVIIYSFCVNRSSQLTQLSNLMEEDGVLIDRKLNVVLTRARKQLILIGVPSLLDKSPLYSELLKGIWHLEKAI